MKRLLLIVFCFVQVYFLHAQIHDSLSQSKPIDSSKQACFHKHIIGTIAASTDLAQYIFQQANICVEYKWNRMTIGIYGGIIKPDPTFFVNPLANGQYKLPGTVYTGYALKLYFKYFSKEGPINYWCAQLECKPEWYNNQNFRDILNTGQDYPYYAIDDYYTMNEKTTVLGIDMLHGHEFEINNFLHIDLFYGLGLHDRIRDYTVTSSTLLGSYTQSSTPQSPYNGNCPGYLIPGTYIGYVWNFTPVIGVKLGIFYPVKKTGSE